MTAAPSPGRLAAAGLVVAAITILALAVLARFELDREAVLHREVIGGLQVKDSLEALRTQIAELRAAARVASRATPEAGSDKGMDPASLQAIERRAVEIDAELEYLLQQPLRSESPEGFETLSRSARLLAMAARAIRARAAAPAAPEEIERLGADALNALERLLATQRRRLNESTVAQLRVGETLRAYVWWLAAGSMAALAALFAVYRSAKLREAVALRRIEQLAHYDMVTGLANRVLLADRLRQEIARARRNETGLALLLFDLDGFKAVNDTWGHAAGDKVLAMVAERVRGCMRASDTAGRLGGDEFLAILPEATQEGALRVAEKLRAVLAQAYESGAFTARLSASVGVAMYPRDGEDPEALQRAADSASYAAKRAGKDRVRLAANA